MRAFYPWSAFRDLYWPLQCLYRAMSFVISATSKSSFDQEFYVFLRVGINFHKLRFGGQTSYHNYRSLAEAQSHSVRFNCHAEYSRNDSMTEYQNWMFAQEDWIINCISELHILEPQINIWILKLNDKIGYSKLPLISPGLSYSAYTTLLRVFGWAYKQKDLYPFYTFIYQQ